MSSTFLILRVARSCERRAKASSVVLSYWITAVSLLRDRSKLASPRTDAMPGNTSTPRDMSKEV
jgi:hypothetical protein